MTRFLHLSTIGLVPSKKNPLRSIEAKTHRTVAYRVNREFTNEDTDQLNTNIEYEVALCHYRDQFNRKIGRAISEGRLLKHGGNFLNVPLPVPTTGDEWRTFENYLRDNL